MSDNYVEHLSSGKSISYTQIRQAMQGQPFTMSLTSDDEKRALIQAVNQGIDSYLEVCNCPQRGDSYTAGERSIIASEDTDYWQAGDKLVLARTIECVVSVESLPTLLRRLTEIEYGEDDEAEGLVDSILHVLGFDDYGNYVGREDD